MIMMLIYCLCLLFVLYSIFVRLLKEGWWYGLFCFVFISLPVVTAIVVCVVAMLLRGYRGVVNCFLEAWKDFTVDVEPGGVPDNEPFEGE